MRGVLSALCRDAGGHARVRLGSVPGRGGRDRSRPATWSSWPKTRGSAFRRSGSPVSRPAARSLLPLRVGEARAADWILTGKTFSGREAAVAGFASRAVDADRLAGETERIAEGLLSASPAALSAALGLLRRNRRDALERGLPEAEEAYRTLTGSANLAQAVRDFETSRRR